MALILTEIAIEATWWTIKTTGYGVYCLGYWLVYGSEEDPQIRTNNELLKEIKELRSEVSELKHTELTPS